jgi:hypothetical protein
MSRTNNTLCNKKDMQTRLAERRRLEGAGMHARWLQAPEEVQGSGTDAAKASASERTSRSCVDRKGKPA